LSKPNFPQEPCQILLLGTMLPPAEWRACSVVLCFSSPVSQGRMQLPTFPALIFTIEMALSYFSWKLGETLLWINNLHIPGLHVALVLGQCLLTVRLCPNKENKSILPLANDLFIKPSLRHRLDTQAYNSFYFLNRLYYLKEKLL
jgi:hypothetical protein